MELQSIYPVVRTNQSGYGVEEYFFFLFAVGPFPVRIGELIEGERKEVIEKLMKIMVENHCM